MARGRPQCVLEGGGSARNKCKCVTRVIDPEVREGDFVPLDSSDGGVPLLHRWFHHMQFVARSIVPFGLPGG
jgi:hypothetical protein